MKKDTVPELYYNAAERAQKPKKSFWFYAMIVLLILLLAGIPLGYVLSLLLPDNIWPTIFGSVFTGILAYAGVVFSIQYYRRSSRETERLRVMPFLQTDIVEVGAEVICDGVKATSDDANTSRMIDDARIVIAAPPCGNDGVPGLALKISIKNSGYGFARVNSVWFEYSDLSVRIGKGLVVGEEIEVMLIVIPESVLAKYGYRFYLSFTDARMQMYCQPYECVKVDDHLLIKSKYPLPIDGAFDRDWFE